MKNKKIIILMIILIIITTVLVACFKLFNGKEEQYSQGNNIKLATSTLEERKIWSNFLKRNPYISEIDITNIAFLDDTNLIKMAISSEDVETEYIVTQEIEENPALSEGDGYKKSIKKINEYLKKIFNKNNVLYNFIDTYVENGEYLIVDENYVYYTKIDLPEKEYILVNFNKSENNFEAEIYEYEINESNRTDVEEMLESGEINDNIETIQAYIITGTIENENICISTKHKI